MCNTKRERRQEYKYAARESLRGTFWPTALVVVVSLLPVIVTTLYTHFRQPQLQWGMTTAQIMEYLRIEGLTLLIQAIIGAPLLLGAKRYYRALARREAANWRMVVQDFRSGEAYMRSLRLWIAIFVYTLGWMIALDIGIIVLNYAISVTPFWAGLIGLPLFLLLGALVMTKTMRFEGAYLRLIDDSQESAWSGCGDCVRRFRGHNWELFCFILSFLLWGIATVCTLGLVGLYARAYQEVSFVKFFDALPDER